jgi:hypothetical protein
MSKQAFYASPTVMVAELFIEKGIAQSTGGTGGGPGETGGVIYDPGEDDISI